MEITYRFLNDKYGWQAQRGTIVGNGTTKEEAKTKLEHYEEMFGGMKWIDAFTGKEVVR